MSELMTAVKRFAMDEGGVTVLEYAIAGALITLALVAAVLALGGEVASNLAALKDAVDG